METMKPKVHIKNYRLLNLSRDEILHEINGVTFYQQLPLPIVHALLKKIQLKQYAENQEIVSKHDERSFMTIMRGGVALFDDEDTFLTALHQGDGLGFRSFMDDKPLDVQAFAVNSSTIIAHLYKTDYDAVMKVFLKPKYYDTGIITETLMEYQSNENLKIKKHERESLFGLFHSDIFLLLAPAAKEKLLWSMKIIQYNFGECIFQEEEEAQYLYILIQGSLSTHKLDEDNKNNNNNHNMNTNRKKPLSPSLSQYGTFQHLLVPGDSFGYGDMYNHTVEPIIPRHKKMTTALSSTSTLSSTGFSHTTQPAKLLRSCSVLARHTCVLARICIPEFTKLLEYNAFDARSSTISYLTDPKFIRILKSKQRTEPDLSYMKQILQELIFFKHMDNAFILALAAQTTFREFSCDEVILREGDQGDATADKKCTNDSIGMFILLSGSVAVMQKNNSHTQKKIEQIKHTNENNNNENNDNNDNTFLTGINNQNNISSLSSSSSHPNTNTINITNTNTEYLSEKSIILGECINMLSPGDTFGEDFLMYGQHIPHSYVARQTCTFAFLSFTAHKQAAIDFKVQTFHGELDLTAVERCLGVLRREAALYEDEELFPIEEEDALNNETNEMKLSFDEAYELVNSQLSQILFFQERFATDSIRKFIYSRMQYLTIQPNELICRTCSHQEMLDTGHNGHIVKTDDGIYIILKGSVALHKRTSYVSMTLADWRERASMRIKNKKELEIAAKFVENVMGKKNSNGQSGSIKLSDVTDSLFDTPEQDIETTKKLSNVMAAWRRFSREGMQDLYSSLNTKHKEKEMTEDELALRVLFGPCHQILSIGNSFGMTSSNNNNTNNTNNDKRNKRTHQPVASYFARELCHLIFIPKAAYSRTTQKPREHRNMDIILPNLMNITPLVFPPQNGNRPSSDDRKYLYMRDIAKHIEVRYISRNTSIYNQGEDADSVYILVSGEAKVERKINISFVSNIQGNTSDSFQICKQNKNIPFQPVKVHSQSHVTITGTSFSLNNKNKNNNTISLSNIDNKNDESLYTVELARLSSGSVFGGHLQREMHEFDSLNSWGYFDMLMVPPNEPIEDKNGEHKINSRALASISSGAVASLVLSFQKKKFQSFPLTNSVIALNQCTIFVVKKEILFSTLPLLPLFQLCQTAKLRERRDRDRVIQFLKVRNIIPELSQEISPLTPILTTKNRKKLQRDENMSVNVFRTTKSLNIVKDVKRGLSRTMPGRGDNIHLINVINKKPPLNKYELNYRKNIKEFHVELDRVLSLADKFTNKNNMEESKYAYAIEKRKEILNKKNNKKPSSADNMIIDSRIQTPWDDIVPPSRNTQEISLSTFWYDRSKEFVLSSGKEPDIRVAMKMKIPAPTITTTTSLLSSDNTMINDNNIENEIELMEQIHRDQNEYKKRVKTLHEKSHVNDARSFHESMNRLAILSNINQQDYPQAYSFDFSGASNGAILPPTSKKKHYNDAEQTSKTSSLTGYKLINTQTEKKKKNATSNNNMMKKPKWTSALATRTEEKNAQKKKLLERTMSLPTLGERKIKKKMVKDAKLLSTDIMYFHGDTEVEEAIEEVLNMYNRTTRSSYDNNMNNELKLSPSKRMKMEKKRQIMRKELQEKNRLERRMKC